jgi:hypothetical protein
MKDEYLIGFAAYQLGGAENWFSAIPQWADYVAAHPTPTEPEPDGDEWEFDYWDLDGVRFDGNPLEIVMDRDHVLTPHARKKVIALRPRLTLNPCPEWAGLVVRVDPADMVYNFGTMVTAEAL